MERLAVVQQLLSNEHPQSEIVYALRDSVEALDAIPMAIFCALRSFKPIPGIQV